MEQGTVVAIVALAGSFLTVLVTGAVNIWSKWIESEQKVKEHQLSIRSVYVTKKIEAAQEYIAKGDVVISMLTNQNNLFELYVKAIDVDDSDFENYFKKASFYESKLSDIKDYAPVYFRQEDLFSEMRDLFIIRSEKNLNIGNLVSLAKHYHSEGNSELVEKTEAALISEINEVITVNNKLMHITSESMRMINIELAKYDIM